MYSGIALMDNIFSVWFDDHDGVDHIVATCSGSGAGTKGGRPPKLSGTAAACAVGAKAAAAAAVGAAAAVLEEVNVAGAQPRNDVGISGTEGGGVTAVAHAGWTIPAPAAGLRSRVSAHRASSCDSPLYSGVALIDVSTRGVSDGGLEPGCSADKDARKARSTFSTWGVGR